MAESKETGHPLHIRNAVSGLACNCRCFCGRDMVAHKGQLRQHFQHAPSSGGRGACLSSGETALHKFAKEVLEKSCRLKLPALSAKQGKSEIHIVKEGEFQFDGVALEERVGEIVPDVQCWKARPDGSEKRVVYVEFKVTHACGPEKIDRLKQMNVGAIEIDLSEYRNRPLEELGEAILFKAPREWLHNPRVAEVSRSLQSMEHRRLDGIGEKARRILSRRTSGHGKNVKEVGEWERQAMRLGLADYVATDGRAFGFYVKDEEWKSFILLKVGIDDRKSATLKEIYSALKLEGWVEKAVEFVDEETASAMRDIAGADVLPPWEAVRDFVEDMKTKQVLIQSAFGGRLSGGRTMRALIQSAVEAEERPAKRRDELVACVRQILGVIKTGEQDRFDFMGWYRSEVEGVVPADLVHQSEDKFTAFRDGLLELRRAVASFDPHIPDGKSYGLPVAAEVARRVENQRRIEERRDQEHAYQLEREAQTRIERLVYSAQNMMKERHQVWIDKPDEVFGGRTPRELAYESEEGCQRVFRHLFEWQRAMAQEEKRVKLKEDCLEKLRVEALRAFRREDKANLWMRQSLKELDGEKPQDYCTDNAALTRCVALLPGNARKADGFR